MFVWSGQRAKCLFYNGKEVLLAYTSDGMIHSAGKLGSFTVGGTPETVSYGIGCSDTVSVFSPDGDRTDIPATPNEGGMNWWAVHPSYDFGQRFFFTGPGFLFRLSVPESACDLNIAGFLALKYVSISNSLIPSEKISKILSDLVANGVQNGVFWRTSSNSPITGDGLTAKQTLKARGWTFFLDNVAET